LGKKTQKAPNHVGFGTGRRKMETRKIALACFIGGILCAVVALIFAPQYWTIGLLAGFAGGYISYEFREVCKAIPIALRATREEILKTFESEIAGVKVWLPKPHPFVYPSVIVSAPIYVWVMAGLLSEIHSSPFIVQCIMVCLLAVGVPVFFVGLIYVVTVPIFTLAFIGARAGKRCYWQPFITIGDKELEAHIQKLKGRGYREKPLTYLNVLRWFIIGLGVIALFFVWTLWKYLGIGFWLSLKFIVRFGWQLFKLIHSQKRVLCAIDGTLGGAISYAWLYTTSSAPAGKIILVFSGGLLGAAFGILNWEIVSKRLLHVQVKNN